MGVYGVAGPRWDELELRSETLAVGDGGVISSKAFTPLVIKLPVELDVVASLELLLLGVEPAVPAPEPVEESADDGGECEDGGVFGWGCCSGTVVLVGLVVALVLVVNCNGCKLL